MVDKKLIVLGLSVVLALGTIGFNWVETILPTAEAHGVQAQNFDSTRSISQSSRKRP